MRFVYFSVKNLFIKTYFELQKVDFILFYKCLFVYCGDFGFHHGVFLNWHIDVT
jgi:hypothetical protein